jgi:S1-C subfamily serine protease
MRKVARRPAVFGRRSVAVTAFCLAALGCAKQEFQPVIAADDVRLFTARDLAPSQYTVISQVTALSCRRSAWDSRASEYSAMEDLRRKAHSAGADGLLDPQCRSSEGGPDLLNNCWQSVECTGTAIALKSGSGPAEPGTGGTASGTGFVVSRSGHILTNAHVVDGCSTLTGRAPSGSFPLTLLNADSQNDLAVLQSSAPLPAVATFRDGRGVRPGDDVIAAGFPLQKVLANQMNVTTGTVSALAGLQDNAAQLQITAPIQPGNSGGPLLDRSGHVVGVVVSKLDALAIASQSGTIPENINFAVKGEVARTYLDSRGVDYLTAASGAAQATADIAEAAKAYTVFITCTLN